MGIHKIEQVESHFILLLSLSLTSRVIPLPPSRRRLIPRYHLSPVSQSARTSLWLLPVITEKL